MSIVIVDSGGANLTSIKNAFGKISSQAVVSIDENIICIMPGSDDDGPYVEKLRNVAKKYNIDRNQQQEFAISSHEKANNADTNGKFEDEITTGGSSTSISGGNQVDGLPPVPVILRGS